MDLSTWDISTFRKYKRAYGLEGYHSKAERPSEAVLSILQSAAKSAAINQSSKAMQYLPENLPEMNAETVPMPSIMINACDQVDQNPQADCLVEVVTKHLNGITALPEVETLVYFIHSLHHPNAILRPPFELACDAVRETKANTLDVPVNQDNDTNNGPPDVPAST